MIRVFPVLVATLCANAGIAQGAQPLSAIDWLSQSVQMPAPALAQPKPKTAEPPVAAHAGTPQVTVTALDAPSPDPTGLLPPETTGLPRDLWALSGSAVLATLLADQKPSPIPAVHELVMTLLLAEADPPLGAGPAGDLFIARIDKLLGLGALDPALAMIEQVSPDTPDLFRRWFDVALLTGAEDAACDVMRGIPTVAPTVQARIFCLARGGDWNAAALSLNTHRVLGDITPAEEALLSRFLDPELYEDEPPLPVPERITPLVFRMFEANGEPLATRQLPNAFAHADLRDITGWKSQLDAAERLTAIGAVSENVLFAAYTARTPAASGGVWDRAKAVQLLDAALRDKNVDDVATYLPAAWDAMREVKLEVPFAKIVVPQLNDITLSGTSADLAVTLGLLTADYETVAQTAPANFLTALAQGRPTAPSTPTETAIFHAFTDGDPDPELEALARNGNLGEALLRSIDTFEDGFAGDPMALTEALALWRMVGLEDIARRAALQLLILDRAP